MAQHTRPASLIDSSNCNLADFDYNTYSRHITEVKCCCQFRQQECYQQFMRTRKAIRHDEQIEREVEKAISKFSQHFMSNSKWVRLINKLIENVDKIKKMEFKKVQDGQLGELYLSGDTIFGFDYWQNGFEGHNSLGGWLTYKEIEYLVFRGSLV